MDCQTLVHLCNHSPALRWLRVFTYRFAMTELLVALEASCPPRTPLKCLPQLLKNMMHWLIARTHHHPNSSILLGIKETNLFLVCACHLFVFSVSETLLLSLLQKVISSLLMGTFLFRQLTDSFLRHLTQHTSLEFLVLAQSSKFYCKGTYKWSLIQCGRRTSCVPSLTSLSLLYALHSSKAACALLYISLTLPLKIALWMWKSP